MTRHQELYAANRAAGLCGATGCGRKSVKSLCKRCAHRNKLRIRARCKENMARGKCYYCGKTREGNTTICAKCIGIQQKWRLKMLRLGRCQYCGDPREDLSLKVCHTCIKWHRDYNKKQVTLGSCQRCYSKPSDGETKYCPKCREINRVRMIRYYWAHK